MSGLFSRPSPPTQDMRAFGQHQQRANTNQQARIVPLLFGRDRLGVTFISDTFDLLSQPVSQSVGKTTTQTGSNFYASFAALVCHGRVDGLFDIYLNGDSVFAQQTPLYAVALSAAGVSGDEFYTATFQTAGPHGLQPGDVVIITGCFDPEFNGEFVVTAVPSATQFQFLIAPTDVTDELARTIEQTNSNNPITANVRMDPVMRDGDNPDFADITIPGYGVMRIYWGTETQAPDEYLIAASGQQHPAYLGLCYIRFTQLFFGFNQTNVPNVELILQRGPAPDFGAQPAALNNGNANPAYVFADLLQNPRAGLGLSDDFLSPALENAAAQFNNESFGVAQVITRDTDVRSTLSALCETCDALPLIDPNTGLLSMLALRPAGRPLGFAITDAQLADLPTFSPQDWSTTYSQVSLVFNDATLFYQDNAITWRDIGMLNVVRNSSILSLDRKWITDEDLATNVMMAAGQQNSLPITTGKIKLLWDDNLFANLSPGSLFQFNLQLRDCGGITFRVTTQTIPDPALPEFEIEFQTDRTYLYNILQNPPPTAFPLDVIVPAPVVPQPNTRFAFKELPAALCAGSMPAVAALVARGSPTQISFNVWLKKNYAFAGAPADSYLSPQTFNRFAQHGSLVFDYPAATQNIDLLIGAVVEFDGPDDTLSEITAFEGLTDVLLVFVDDEIMSVAGWALQAAGVYRLQLLRGRFGTPIETHAAGAQVLIIARMDLPVISSKAFQPDVAQVFQFSLGNQQLSNATGGDLTIAGLALRMPPPAALKVNGNFVNPVCPLGVTPFTVSWALPDARMLAPSADPTRLVTRLQYYDGLTLIAQEDVPWTAVSADGAQQLSVAHRFSDFGLSDRSFTVAASTVNKTSWKEIPSAASTQLAVQKHP